MAIPTSFGPITPNGGVTNVFPLPGLTSYGIDVAGTQTPKAVRVADKLVLVMEQTYTDAQLVSALVSFLQNRGYAQASAGGAKVVALPQETPALTLCT